MKRRDFVIGLLLISATTASAQAQQKGKIDPLTVVDPINPVSDIAAASELPYYRGLFESLQQLGFTEGRNLRSSDIPLKDIPARPRHDFGGGQS